MSLRSHAELTKRHVLEDYPSPPLCDVINRRSLRQPANAYNSLLRSIIRETAPLPPPSGPWAPPPGPSLISEHVRLGI